MRATTPANESDSTPRRVAYTIKRDLQILGVATAAVAYALNLRLSRPSCSDDRSPMLLRASHVRLLVSMVMLVASALWFRPIGQPSRV